MNFIRKIMTAKGRYTVENFNEKRQEFLSNLMSIIQYVKFEEIPPELLLHILGPNWYKVGAISILGQCKRGDLRE